MSLVPNIIRGKIFCHKNDINVHFFSVLSDCGAGLLGVHFVLSIISRQLLPLSRIKIWSQSDRRGCKSSQTIVTQPSTIFQYSDKMQNSMLRNSADEEGCMYLYCSCCAVLRWYSTMILGWYLNGIVMVLASQFGNRRRWWS